MDTNSFHIDPNTGMPRPCSRPDDCGWGSAAEHYPTAREAMRSYEEMMREFLWTRHRLGSNGKPTRELVPRLC